jgi:hypothetical protein
MIQYVYYVTYQYISISGSKGFGYVMQVSDTKISKHEHIEEMHKLARKSIEKETGIKNADVVITNFILIDERIAESD